MAKYHVSPTTGNPNVCKATKSCPFGGEAEHFSSREVARTAYESAQSGSFTTSAANRKKIAAQYEALPSWPSYPTNPTQEELILAAAHAVENKKFVAIGYQETVSDKPLDLILDYDGTGGDRATVATRSFRVATPEGKFQQITYRATVDADHDGYWQFHPSLDSEVTQWDNPSEAYQTSVTSTRYSPDTDEFFYKTDRGGSSPSYDYSSESDTRRKARSALVEVGQPFELGRARRLSDPDVKLSPKLLSADRTIKSPQREVREAAAHHPQLPREAQVILAKDSHSAVRAALASRSDLTPEVRELLLSDGERNFGEQNHSPYTPRETLLANPTLPRSVAEREARRGSLQDLRALNRNSQLASSVREIMQRRVKDLQVRL